MKCDFQQEEASKKSAIQAFRVNAKANNIHCLNAKIMGMD